ncbi:CapA family protein [Peribacillus simplex]|uniref:CapA family protein n=1 Tax=Peribacillus simplex TaxID=1478 RepID=UPI003D28B2B9
MNILIGGDLVPTKSNIDLFNNSDISSLLGEELCLLWRSAEMRIFNLEVPLLDKESPIAKCGPNLISPTSTISGIKALNPSLITLANNHILDHGIPGLHSTENLLEEYNIPFIGVGKNVANSSEPYIFERNGISIGVYTCAENEFTIATDKSPGANPFDPLESLDHIEKLKSMCDYVIVLYHGGKEHYRYPSPNLQKVCRKITEKGADLVICQHSHCIGCHEDYNGSTIVYGQGNFIFDRYDNEFWNSSLLINVDFHNEIKIDYIPIVKKGNGVRLATGQISKELLSEFHYRSNEILQAGFIEQKYREFAQENIESYLSSFSGYGKWLSRIDRRLFKGMLTKKKYSKSRLLAMQNYIECEAHKELILNGIKVRSNNDE